MNITVLANRDLSALIAVNLLLGRLQDHTVHLVLSDSVGRPQPHTPAALLELKALEQTLLNDLVTPLAGALPAAGQRSANSRLRLWDELVGELAEAPVTVNRPRSPEGRAGIAATQPELIISIRYGGILDAEHAALPRHGILNLHSGRLPEYRGVLASFRAVMAGDTELTCTVHRIVDRGIDTGPIIATHSMPLLPARSLLYNILRLYAPGTALLGDAVTRLQRGESLTASKQIDDGAYFSAPDAAELAAFHARGGRLCDAAEVVEVLRVLLLGTDDERAALDIWNGG